MNKVILFLLLMTATANAALTVGNVPKVKTGGTSPSIENSSITDNGGNIGIGTTTPEQRLFVSSTNDGGFVGIQLKNLSVNSASTAGIKFGITSSNYAGAEISGIRDTSNGLKILTDTVERMRFGGSAQDGNIGIGTTVPEGLFNITSSASKPLFLVHDNGAGDTTPTIIDADGNIGIGVQDPGSRLGVFTSSGLPQIRLGNSDSFYWELSRDNLTTGRLDIGDQSGTEVSVLNNGNVGIGTTAPREKLEVNGVVRPTGYKSSDGTSGVTVTTCTGFKDGLCISGT